MTLLIRSLGFPNRSVASRETWQSSTITTSMGRRSDEGRVRRHVFLSGLLKPRRPRPRERGLAMPNAAPQSTPHIGEGSGGEIPGIGLFLTFLAFRASVRNGCASRWVSGQRMRRAPRKRSVSYQPAKTALGVLHSQGARHASRPVSGSFEGPPDDSTALEQSHKAP
jgi:hypothetical protein